MFFGQDRRTNTATKNAVLLQIQPVKKVVDILHPHEISASQIDWSDNEVVLVETDGLFIQPQQLIRRRSDVNIQWSMLGSPPVSFDVGPSITSIQCVFNRSSRRIHSLRELLPPRGELEIDAFGRDFLVSQLRDGIQSFPMVIFVNGFGLYRNMY